METLIIRDEGGIRLVELNRPDAFNALNGQMTKELAEIFTATATNDSIKVLVLTGNGKAFWAGADLKEPPTLRAEWFGQMVEAAIDLPKTFPHRRQRCWRWYWFDDLWPG